LLETGRVEIIYNPETRYAVRGNPSLSLISRWTSAGINWPGELQIGTRVIRIGRSSVTFDQCMFQGIAASRRPRRSS